jgi:hypothetical protein
MMRKLLLILIGIIISMNAIHSEVIKKDLIIETQGDNAYTHSKACINGNSVYCIGEIASDRGELTHFGDIMIMKFNFENGEIFYDTTMIHECIEEGNDDYRITTNSKSIVLPNQYDGIDIYSIKTEGIRHQKPKLFSINQNLEIVDSYVTMDSNYIPPRLSGLTPMCLGSDEVITTVSLEMDSKWKNPRLIMENKFDTDGKFISQDTLIHVDSLELQRMNESPKIDIQLTKIQDIFVVDENLFISLKAKFTQNVTDESTETIIAEYLIKFDSDRKIDWIKSAYDYIPENKLSFINYIIGNDNQIYVTGRFSSLPQSSQDKERNIIYKINSETGYIMEQSELFANFDNAGDFKIDSDSQGNLLISGRYIQYMPQIDANFDKYYIAKFNTDLQMEWQFYEHPKNENQTSYYECLELNEGQYLFIGRKYIDKTTSYLYCIVVNEGTSSIIENQINSEIHTSIINCTLRIEFDEDKYEGSELIISELSGRILLRRDISISTTEISIDISNYPNGPYIVALNSKNGISTSKFIKNN